MTRFFILFGLLAPSLSFGQQYSVNWSKVGGGGAASTHGQYSVNATIGQPDATPAMCRGQYSATGGFWAVFAVQTPDAPVLKVNFAGNRPIVSWPASAKGWVLQTNSRPGATGWVDYHGTVANNCVTNAPSSGTIFFRLMHN